MANPKQRNEARKTKCPHCDWTGSARGLFGHVRFKHIGMEESLNIRKENPYLIEEHREYKKRKPIDVEFQMHEDDLILLRAKRLIIAINKILKEFENLPDPTLPNARRYRY